jgi:ABC-type proline/glycine betaine transport system permease subunit
MDIFFFWFMLVPFVITIPLGIFARKCLIVKDTKRTDKRVSRAVVLMLLFLGLIPIVNLLALIVEIICFMEFCALVDNKFTKYWFGI